MPTIDKEYKLVSYSVLDAYNVAHDGLPKLLDAFEMKDVTIVNEHYGQTFNGVSRGFVISGGFEVEDNVLRISVKIPFAALIFRSKIEKALDRFIGDNVRHEGNTRA